MINKILTIAWFVGKNGLFLTYGYFLYNKSEQIKLLCLVRLMIWLAWEEQRTINGFHGRWLRPADG
jgi:hypothetical protein